MHTILKMTELTKTVMVLIEPAAGLLGAVTSAEDNTANNL